MKKCKEKISMITAYDYSMAKCVSATSIDIILIGDSLGMVVLGYEDTLQVTVENVIYHCSAVRRGAPETFIIADMPYLSYHLSEEQTRKNAADLIIKGKADAVKLEGGYPSRIDAIKAIVDMEIPCLLYTSDAADDLLCVDLGGRRIIKKKTKTTKG